jgi:hypothetical protein
MDQDENFEYKVTMNMSFTREEMVKLATLGMQAAVGVAILDKEAIVDLVEEEEEDDVEKVDDQEPVHINISFTEIEALYHYAKTVYNPNLTNNSFVLSEIPNGPDVADLMVNYNQGTSTMKITDKKAWK